MESQDLDGLGVAVWHHCVGAVRGEASSQGQKERDFLERWRKDEFSFGGQPST